MLIQNYCSKSSLALNKLSLQVFSDKKLQQVNRKLSELLYQCMAGMSPSKNIEEEDNMEGGLIIVKKDFSIHSFSSYSGQSVVKLKRKLLEHSFFESPSTSRWKYGFAYEQDGKVFFDLVAQIRLHEID